jgi:aminoglycoside phosphotransferase (APT) family kinase protein
VTHFPELEVERLILVAEGWDNAVWVADEEWAFRFPRRTIAVRGVSLEIEVLPRLAPLLPLPVPVPVPVFHGVPGDEYPWPYFGFRFLPGREVVVAGLDDAARVQLARPLGRFLRALHERGAPAVAAVDLPRDPLGRADPQIRVPRTRGRLEKLERIGVTTPVAELSALLDDAERLPLPSTAALVHGDLHSRHLLVDDDHRLTGVIDWGDLCLSDPSVDLSIVWSFLPSDGRSAFTAEYGPITDETALRARMLAVSLTASLAHQAHVDGMATLEREALAGLARAAAG